MASQPLKSACLFCCQTFPHHFFSHSVAEIACSFCRVLNFRSTTKERDCLRWNEMCWLCVKREQTDNSKKVDVFLDGHRLTSWRRSTLELIRNMMGNKFRIDQLRHVSKDEYGRLYKEVFWDRVHPIYRLYMQTKSKWDLQQLWFKVKSKFTSTF